MQMNYNSNAKVVQLDLSDLSSVRAAAAELREKHAKIDRLLNNAGVMQTPQQRTKDDFELQLGTNHLGHFLLTGLLIDLVEAAKGRVVTVSSIAHLPGVINFDDMSDFNKDLRSKLNTIANITPPKIEEIHESEEGTIKYLIKLTSAKTSTS